MEDRHGKKWEKDSAAEKAGIQLGDVITKIAGKKTDDVAYLRYELYQHSAGDEVEVTVLRDGKEKTFKVTLGKNEYFVLGDNRENSTDSRVLGPIDKKQIKGKGILLFATCSSVSSSGKCKGLKLRWPKTIK